MTMIIIESRLATKITAVRMKVVAMLIATADQADRYRAKQKEKRIIKKDFKLGNRVVLKVAPQCRFLMQYVRKICISKFS